jgi:hypothetical protein
MPITVGNGWFAPNPSPMAMAIKKYPNSSGSLIAVLNLIIDNAPTSPKESAKEDFTMLMIIKVVTPTKMRTLERWDLLDKDLPYFT